MKYWINTLLILSTGALVSACVSTAESIIDGVAAQGEKGVAMAFIQVEEDSCRQPPLAVGKVAMWEHELSEKVTVSRIVNVCAKKWKNPIDEDEVRRGYREALRQRCDATLVRPQETNQYAKLSNKDLCSQLPEFKSYLP